MNISYKPPEELKSMESGILGAFLCGSQLPDFVVPEIFYNSRNRIICKAVLELKKNKITPDILTVSKHLRETGNIDNVGGAGYIASLTNDTPLESVIPYYTKTISDEYEKRRLHTMLAQSLEDLEKGKRDVSEIVNGLNTDLKNTVSTGTDNGFYFQKIGELQSKAPSWLVDRLLERNSFSCLFGDPESGKSFFAIELGACVATGTPFYGLPVKHPGPVIYIAGEGTSGLKRRFDAWSIARRVSLKDAPLYLNHGAVSLIDHSLMLPVVNALEGLVTTIKQPPALVILDTWSRVLGGDDSAPSDAAAGVAALDSLRDRFGNFAAMVIHHCGNGDKNRSRGWSGLRASVDTELIANRGADRILRLSCTKAKDTDPIEPMAFEFHTVELGIVDDDGVPVNSAVLDRIGWTSPEITENKPRGKNQTLALDVLKRIASETKGSEGNNGVSLEKWKETCKEVGLDRSQFWYAQKGLEKNGIIQTKDGSAFLGVGLDVGFRGVLYTPPNPSNVSNACTPVGNSTIPTLSNVSNASEKKANAKKSQAPPVSAPSPEAGDVGFDIW
jgi:hypothetical protein